MCVYMYMFAYLCVLLIQFSYKFIQTSYFQFMFFTNFYVFFNYITCINIQQLYSKQHIFLTFRKIPYKISSLMSSGDIILAPDLYQPMILVSFCVLRFSDSLTTCHHFYIKIDLAINFALICIGYLQQTLLTCLK